MYIYIYIIHLANLLQLLFIFDVVGEKWVVCIIEKMQLSAGMWAWAHLQPLAAFGWRRKIQNKASSFISHNFGTMIA